MHLRKCISVLYFPQMTLRENRIYQTGQLPNMFIFNIHREAKFYWNMWPVCDIFYNNIHFLVKASYKTLRYDGRNLVSGDHVYGCPLMLLRKALIYMFQFILNLFCEAEVRTAGAITLYRLMWPVVFTRMFRKLCLWTCVPVLFFYFLWHSEICLKPLFKVKLSDQSFVIW